MEGPNRSTRVPLVAAINALGVLAIAGAYAYGLVWTVSETFTTPRCTLVCDRAAWERTMWLAAGFAAAGIGLLVAAAVDLLKRPWRVTRILYLVCGGLAMAPAWLLAYWWAVGYLGAYS